MAGSFYACARPEFYARARPELREMEPVPKSSPLLFVLSFTPLFGYIEFPHLSHTHEKNSLHVVEILSSISKVPRSWKREREEEVGAAEKSDL